ncbi:hypothetical protein QTO34_004088 [Cnephaeus nilssonii]|uniref:Hydroxymethylglutaryl-coenzyme A synthase C-terminal domain-containing protein n=1 Tax=Cnephaeus nilssonii TaxID=3371016 RepID=A0AA40LLU8_CNENI|nr:hypothetical protein QTO34_004088 [Eptesicus nilssonii]
MVKDNRGDSPQQLAGKRTGVFSYGSGLAATLHSLKVTQDATPGSALDKITASLCDRKSRLHSRTCVTAAVFAESMKLREDTPHLVSCIPQSSTDSLFEGAGYLVRVDEKHRRTYARRPAPKADTLDEGVGLVHSSTAQVLLRKYEDSQGQQQSRRQLSLATGSCAGKTRGGRFIAAALKVER